MQDKPSEKYQTLAMKPNLKEHHNRQMRRSMKRLSTRMGYTAHAETQPKSPDRVRHKVDDEQMEQAKHIPSMDKLPPKGNQINNKHLMFFHEAFGHPHAEALRILLREMGWPISIKIWKRLRTKCAACNITAQ